MANEVAIPLVTFAHGADGDVLAYLTSRYFGLRNFGQIYGYVFAAFALGSGVGPVLMGRVHDFYGNYGLGLLGAAVAFVCAYVLSFMLGSYPYRGADIGQQERSAQPNADIENEIITRGAEH